MQQAQLVVLSVWFAVVGGSVGERVDDAGDRTDTRLRVTGAARDGTMGA